MLDVANLKSSKLVNNIYISGNTLCAVVLIYRLYKGENETYIFDNERQLQTDMENNQRLAFSLRLTLHAYAMHIASF